MLLGDLGHISTVNKLFETAEHKNLFSKDRKLKKFNGVAQKIVLRKQQSWETAFPELLTSLFWNLFTLWCTFIDLYRYYVTLFIYQRGNHCTKSKETWVQIPTCILRKLKKGCTRTTKQIILFELGLLGWVALLGISSNGHIWKPSSLLGP